MNYIVTDEGRGGGCLEIITVLLKVEGGSSRMITVLHRGGPAKEWFTLEISEYRLFQLLIFFGGEGYLGTPKSDYVI